MLDNNHNGRQDSHDSTGPVVELHDLRRLYGDFVAVDGFLLLVAGRLYPRVVQ